jgi:hypothetical protein
MKVLVVPYKDTVLKIQLDDAYFERYKDAKWKVVCLLEGTVPPYYFRRYENGKYIHLHKDVAGAVSAALSLSRPSSIDRRRDFQGRLLASTAPMTSEELARMLELNSRGDVLVASNAVGKTQTAALIHSWTMRTATH